MQSIIRRIETVNSGEPWFGRNVLAILEEVDPKKATVKPASPAGRPGGKGHSILELLYHMITWAEFTLKRIEKDDSMDLVAFEKLDWREISPKLHTWKKALAAYKAIHKKIVALLNKKDDDFLLEMVDYRKYNYRFLLNGMIDHNIYHLGQIAYVNKMLT